MKNCWEIKSPNSIYIDGEEHTLFDVLERLVSAEDSQFIVTKRELFAAAAMQGTIARGYWGESEDDKAKECVQAADALLAALEQTSGGDDG